MDTVLTPAARMSSTPLILRGIFSLAFGVLALLVPGPTLVTMALVFGVYAFVDGLFAIVTGARLGRQHEPWGLSIFEGLLGLGAGVISFLFPGITILALTIIVGVWAVVTGAVEIYAALKLERVRVGQASRVLMGVAGVVSVALGAIMLASPPVGAVVLISLVAAYSLIFGAIFVGLGIRLRHDQAGSTPSELAPPRAA